MAVTLTKASSTDGDKYFEAESYQADDGRLTGAMLIEDGGKYFIKTEPVDDAAEDEPYQELGGQTGAMLIEDGVYIKTEPPDATELCAVDIGGQVEAISVLATEDNSITMKEEPDDEPSLTDFVAIQPMVDQGDCLSKPRNSGLVQAAVLPKPKRKITRCLVHWVDEQKVSIEPVSSVLGQATEETICNIKYKGRSPFRGMIVKISDDYNFLKQQEAELAAKMAERSGQESEPSEAELAYLRATQSAVEDQWSHAPPKKKCSDTEVSTAPKRFKTKEVAVKQKSKGTALEQDPENDATSKQRKSKKTAEKPNKESTAPAIMKGKALKEIEGVAISALAQVMESPPHTLADGCSITAVPTCSRCKALEEEVAKLRKQLEEATEKTELHNVVQADVQGKPQAGVVDATVAEKCGMVEIVKSSGVYVYPAQMALISNATGFGPLLTQLVWTFFDKEELARSNMAGRNGKEQLNKTIIEAITAYTSSHHPEIKKAKARRLIGQKCIDAGRGSKDGPKKQPLPKKSAEFVSSSDESEEETE